VGRKDSRKYLYQLQDIFAAPNVEEARNRKDRLVEELQSVKPEIANWLDEEIESCFSVYGLPESHWKRMRSTNMLERFNQELKRRSRVIRIFPNDNSCVRVLGTLCIEQSEEWETGRIYLNMEPLKKNKLNSEWVWQDTLNMASATLQPC
jgi:putative transposase